MKESEPLKGQTVVFTGTPKSEDVFELVRKYGGNPVSLPLIQVAELMEPTDKLRLDASPTYDWLIFTSQSAVDAFDAKLKRHGCICRHDSLKYCGNWHTNCGST